MVSSSPIMFILTSNTNDTLYTGSKNETTSITYQPMSVFFVSLLTIREKKDIGREF